MNNQFSENLKKIRKEHNLSQEQLADELGVSRQAISKWESAVAYPEMDKIIALCNKFNVNIDDLLHKDIKEVKGEEESKKKLNNVVDDFLSFVTNTINLFSNMNFKSKMKCLFEQLIIAVILFLSSILVYSVLDNLFGHFISFMPNKIALFITNLLDSVLVVALLAASIIIIAHIFKTRYLDYYERIIEEPDNENNTPEDEETSKNKKVEFKKDDKKIIIRDPKHSEYRFINALFKIVILIVKFFLLCFGLVVAFILICQFISFVASFLVYKTGIFFIGLLFAILSSSAITVIILVLILNFIFNRKNNKKRIIWGFIFSLIGFGLGCGMIAIGTIYFDVIEEDTELLKVVTREYEMNDDLVIYPVSNKDIEYVKTDSDSLKVEYSVYKYCDIDDDYKDYHNNEIMAWTYCDNPMKVAREFIKNVNEKKIVLIDDDIDKITVYTNQSNIDKLKSNWSNYYNSTERIREETESYQSRINELEKENSELQREIEELSDSLDECDELDD